MSRLEKGQEIEKLVLIDPNFTNEGKIRQVPTPSPYILVNRVCVDGGGVLLFPKSEIPKILFPAKSPYRL